MIKAIKMKVAVTYAKTTAVLKDSRGEGFVDSAIFTVEDVHDSN